MEERQRIPVTVVGGFLGAGKTTLVNHLLRTSPLHFGVIVNEFGAVGVDGGLIEEAAQSAGDVQELRAGCLCCVGQEDFLRALVSLAARPEVEGGPPDHILVELSGLADPTPVLATLLQPDVRAAFVLDSLVAVVDARNLPRTLQENPEAALQLAYATTTVLNKADLVAPDELAAAEQICLSIHPMTRVLCAEQGQIGAEALLGLRAFSADWEPPSNPHMHTPEVRHVLLEADTPLSGAAWYAFAHSISTRPAQVLRVKGHLALEGQPHKLLLHAVRDLITVEPTKQPNDGRSELVMIGRGIDKAAEAAQFTAWAAGTG